MAAYARVRRNLLSLAGAELMTKLVGFGLYVVIARYLGPDDFGVYSVAVSFSMIFALLANLGIDAFLVKEIARDDRTAGELFSAAAGLKLAGGAAAFAALALIGRLLHYAPGTYHAILIFALVLFVRPVNDLMDAVFRGFQRMEFSAFMKIGRNLVSVSIIGVLILCHRGVLAITGAHAGTGVLLLVVFYAFVVRRTFCRFQPSAVTRQRLGWLLRGGGPFLILGMIYVVNAKTDVLMLSKLATVESVGIYDAGNQLILILLIIPSLVSQAVYPIFASQAEAKRDAMAVALNFIVKLMIALGVPAGVGIALLAPEIVGLMFGDRYAASAEVLQILSAGLAVVFIRSILGWGLAAVERVKQAMWINILNLAINIALNAWLIPVHVEKGAAVATITSMVLTTAGMLWVAKRSIPGLAPVWRMFVRPLACAALMAAFLVQGSGLHLVVKVAGGIAVYAVPLILLRGFTRQELRALRRSAES